MALPRVDLESSLGGDGGDGVLFGEGAAVRFEYALEVI